MREDEEKEENKQGHERRDGESLHLQRTLEAQATRCHVNTRQIVGKHQARVKRNPSCFFPPLLTTPAFYLTPAASSNLDDSSQNKIPFNNNK